MFFRNNVRKQILSPHNDSNLRTTFLHRLETNLDLKDLTEILKAYDSQMLIIPTARFLKYGRIIDFI